MLISYKDNRLMFRKSWPYFDQMMSRLQTQGYFRGLVIMTMHPEGDDLVYRLEYDGTQDEELIQTFIKKLSLA